MRTGVNIGSCLFLVVSTFLAFYYSEGSDQLYWQDKFPFESWATAVLLMFVGIIFGCLYRQICGKCGDINIWHEFKNVWKSTSLWTALLCSPIVFGGVVVGVAREDPSGPLALWFSFQTGFFCESIFSNWAMARGKGNQ